MNEKILSALTLVGILAAVATYVFAQQITPATKAGKLNDAIALLNEGKPIEARGIITNIPPSDPEHGAAQFYEALALSEANDRLGLLNKLDSLKTNKAAVPAQLREELAVRQLDVLFHYRKFDDLLSNAAAFKQAYANSAQASVVTEHQLAALFERGMKKTTEACGSKDQAVFDKRWAEGKANLEQFLTLAASFTGTNYTRIKKHTLSEDIQVARLTLGDEKAVLEEASIQDDAVRENVGLMRVRLYQKLQPEKVDRNLELMKEFLVEFPASPSRKRVEFDMASISFPMGERLIKDAEVLESKGDVGLAAEKRSLAARYFETLRSVQSHAVVDLDSGIEASDILDLKSDVFYSHYLEKNDSTLLALTTATIAQSESGDMNWIVAKVYDGIRLASQNPPALAAATKSFDEVLSFGFSGKPDHDYYMLLAMRWRFNIAVKQEDQMTIKGLFHQVQESQCTKNLKETFLKEHALLAGQATQPTFNLK